MEGLLHNVSSCWSILIFRWGAREGGGRREGKGSEGEG